MLYAPTEDIDKPIADMNPLELASAYARCLDSLSHLDAMRNCTSLPDEWEYEHANQSERKAAIRARLWQISQRRKSEPPPSPSLDR